MQLDADGLDDKYISLPEGAEEHIAQAVSQGEPVTSFEVVGEYQDHARVTYNQDKSVYRDEYKNGAWTDDLDGSPGRWKVTYNSNGEREFSIIDGRSGADSVSFMRYPAWHYSGSYQTGTETRYIYVRSGFIGNTENLDYVSSYNGSNIKVGYVPHHTWVDDGHWQYYDVLVGYDSELLGSVEYNKDVVVTSRTDGGLFDPPEETYPSSWTSSPSVGQKLTLSGSPLGSIPYSGYRYYEVTTVSFRIGTKGNSEQGSVNYEYYKVKADKLKAVGIYEQEREWIDTSYWDDGYEYERFKNYRYDWDSNWHQISDTRLTLQFQTTSPAYEIWEDRPAYGEVTVLAEQESQKNIVAYETVAVTGEENVFTTSRVFEDAGQQAFGDFDLQTLMADQAIHIQSGANATLNGIITSQTCSIIVTAGSNLSVEGLLPDGADPATTQKARAELVVEDNTQTINLTAAGSLTIADSAYLGSVDANGDDAAAEAITITAGTDLTLSGTLFANSSLTALAGQGATQVGSIFGDIYSNLYAIASTADMTFTAGALGGDINLNGASLTVSDQLTFLAPAGAINLIDAPIHAVFLRSSSQGSFNAGASANDGKLYLTSAISQVDIEVTGAGDIALFNFADLQLDRLETPDGSITLYNIGDVVADSILAPQDVTLIIHEGTFTYPDYKLLDADKLTFAAKLPAGSPLLKLQTKVNTLAVRILSGGDVAITNHGTGTLTLDGFDVMNGNLEVVHIGTDLILKDVVLGANQDDYKVEMSTGGDILIDYLRAGHYYLDSESVPDDTAEVPGAETGVSANVDINLISQTGSITELGDDPGVDLIGDRIILTAVTGITDLEIAANGLEATTTNGDICLTEEDGNGEKTLGLRIYDVQAPAGSVDITAEHDLFVFYIKARDDVTLEATAGLLVVKEPVTGVAIEPSDTTLKNISMRSNSDLKTYQFFSASESITYVANGLFDFNFTDGDEIHTGTLHFESAQTFGLNKVDIYVNGDVTMKSDGSVFLFGDLYGVDTLTLYGRGLHPDTGIVRVVSETNQDVAEYDLRGPAEVYLESGDSTDIVFKGYLGGLVENTNSAVASFVTYGGLTYDENSGSGIYGDQMVIQANLLRSEEKTIDLNFNRALNLSGESQFISGKGDLTITTVGDLVMPDGLVNATKYNIDLNPTNAGQVNIGQVYGERLDVYASGLLKLNTAITTLNAVLTGSSAADYDFDILEADELIVELATALAGNLRIIAMGSVTATYIAAKDTAEVAAIGGDLLIGFVGVDPLAGNMVLAGQGGVIKEAEPYDGTAPNYTDNYDLIGHSALVSAGGVYLNGANKHNLDDHLKFHSDYIYGLIDTPAEGLEFNLKFISSKIDPRTLQGDQTVNAAAIDSYLIFPNAPLEIITTGNLTFTPEAIGAMQALVGRDGNPIVLTDLIVRARETLTIEAIPTYLPVVLGSGQNLLISDGSILTNDHGLSLVAAGSMSQQNGDPITVAVQGQVNIETSAPGDVNLNALGNLNLGTTKIKDGNLDLNAEGGLSITKIDAGTTGEVTLTAGAGITVTDVIKSDTLSVSVSGGVQMNTQVGELNVTNTGTEGGINVTQNKRGGDLTIGTIQQAAGNTNPISLTTTEGSINLPTDGTFVANGNVNFNAQGEGADVNLGQQLVSPGTVTIHADGGDIIGNAQNGTDIIAQELIITVGHQAGNTTAPLNTEVSVLGGMAYNSTMVIHNTGDLTISGEGLSTSANGDGTIEIITTGNLTVNGDIFLGAGGTIYLEAQGGDLILNDRIYAVGEGNLTLKGDNIFQNAPAPPIEDDGNGDDDECDDGDEGEDCNILEGGFLSTTGANTITVTAVNGNITMASGITTTTQTGAIVYTATGNVALSQLTSTSGVITVTAGSGDSISGAITDNSDTEAPNIITTGAVILSAETGIGAAGESDIDTTIPTLQATNLTSGEIVIEETDGLVIPVAGITSAGGISLKLAAGNLTLDGSLTSQGNGDITIAVTTGDLDVNAVISSTSGNISLTANNIDLAANVTTTGTLDLLPVTNLVITDGLTLGGSMVSLDGVIQVGATGNEITTLNITGGLTLKATSQLTIQVYDLGAGTGFDVINRVYSQ